MPSPFEFDLNSQALPSAFYQQYFYSADAPYSLVLEGNSDRVWHRPFWLWPVFLLLTWFEIFFPETGENIFTRLQIIGGRDSEGQPYHNWNRTFKFGRDRFFNARMTYNKELQAVTERMGPGGLLQIAWRIQFTSPDKLEISSTKCFVGFGKRRIYLWPLFYPSVKVIETALSDDNIHVELVASHPLLGDIFGYSGTFTLRRLERSS